MPNFFMFKFFEIPHFSHFQNQMGKMRHFEKLARDRLFIIWASHGTLRIIISSEINKVIGNKKIIYFTEIFDHANLETFWAQK